MLFLAGVELIFFTAASCGFGNCAENRFDNTEIFLLLLNSADSVKASYTFPMRRLGVNKDLGGDTARTVDSS